jgi:phosphate transport system substrate-binding protein
MRHGVGRRSTALVGGVALGLLLVATAVAGSTQVNPTYNLKKLKGSVTADGSSTVGPYTTAAAELFARAGASGVKVTVGISGTGGGFQRFCRGEIDLSDASRAIKAAEAAECIKNGVGYRRAFTVANDALTVVVNQQNTWAKCLSTDELKKIWDQGSKVNNWKDVRPGFPDVPLKLFGPGTDSGTFDYFTEAINGKSKRSRTDFQASEDDNVLVQGVSGERGGLGYFGYSYFVENQSRLNAVEIRNPKTGTCVVPSKTSAQNGQYKPLARPLFIYAKSSSFERREVQAFLDYIFDNEVAIANRADFISLTPQQLKKARATFYAAVKSASKS